MSWSHNWKQDFERDGCLHILKKEPHGLSELVRADFDNSIEAFFSLNYFLILQLSSGNIMSFFC